MTHSPTRARQLLEALCPDRDICFDIVHFDPLSNPSRLQAAIYRITSCAIVGISITTSRQAQVASIVLATPDIVVVINGLRRANPAMIAILESQVLCNPDLTLLGLDMQQMAFSLYSGVGGAVISRGMDILSLLERDKRNPNKFMVDLLGPTTDTDAFAAILNSGPKRDPSTLSIVEACIFALAATRTEIVSLIRTQPWPRISTAPERIPHEVMEVLAHIRRTSQQLHAIKPTVLKNDVAREATQSKDTLQVTCLRFQTRVRRSSQRVVVEDDSGKKIMARVSGSKGRSGSLKMNSATPLDSIRTLTTLGRDDPTTAETYRTDLLLQALQGRIQFELNPAFCQVWLLPGSSPTPYISMGITPAIELSTTVTLNRSQTEAVRLAASPLPPAGGPIDIQLIRGPPGTGKTSVIAASVQALRAQDRCIWLVAQSNVAVKNVAQKLADVGFWDFHILVSLEFHFEWHEHLYEQIARRVIVSDAFGSEAIDIERRLGSSKVILCTISMISSKKLRKLNIKTLVPMDVLIVDEASQIELSDYLGPLHDFQTVLRRIVFVGDEKQLAPYGSEEIPELQSIFDIPAHRSRALMLDTSYRLPRQICEFISRHVYEGRLKSHDQSIRPGVYNFVDIPEGEEVAHGYSYKNVAEADTCIALARALVEQGKADFRIITLYNPQRDLIEEKLEASGLPWEDKVFCVDSFQGNEAEYIIISIVRSGHKVGFMRNERRMNVMLSRCKRAMYLVTSRRFLTGHLAAATLVGKWNASNWLTRQDVLNGRV